MSVFRLLILRTPPQGIYNALGTLALDKYTPSLLTWLNKYYLPSEERGSADSCPIGRLYIPASTIPSNKAIVAHFGEFGTVEADLSIHACANSQAFRPFRSGKVCRKSLFTISARQCLKKKGQNSGSTILRSGPACCAGHAAARG